MIEMVYDYDTFEIGNESLSATPAALGQDNTGTVIVSTNYRMKLMDINLNAGTVAGVVTVQKVLAVGASTVTILSKSLAANTSLGPEDIGTLDIEAGYYLQASISAGAGSITAKGVFLLG